MTIRELLHKIEWIGAQQLCPACERAKANGHLPTCELKITLSRLALTDKLNEEVAHATARRARIFGNLGLPA